MFVLLFFVWIEITNLVLKPVLTLSPVCNSDITTDLPFSTKAFAKDGKQLLDDSRVGK